MGYYGYRYVYAKNTEGIKAGNIVFRDRRTKLDSGYFYVEKVEEILLANSNPPGQIETRVHGRKIAYRDLRPCKGKLREFDVSTCKLVDHNYASEMITKEIEAARAKNEALLKILGEVSDLNV
jgi:hypothetical protein